MNPTSVIEVLESQSIGVKLVQYLASGCALAALAARGVSGGAQAGYELIARLLSALGLASLTQWITGVGVPALRSWPHGPVGVAVGLIVTALALMLATRLQWPTDEVTPQPAFGVLPVGALATDAAVLSRGDVGFLVAVAAVIGLLVGRFSTDGSWVDGLRVAMAVVIAPVAAILYIPLAVVTWLTASGEVVPSRVRVDEMPTIVRVQIVDDEGGRPSGARPIRL